MELNFWEPQRGLSFKCDSGHVNIVRIEANDLTFQGAGPTPACSKGRGNKPTVVFRPVTVDTVSSEWNPEKCSAPMTLICYLGD